MSDKRLLNCPFCGGKAKTYTATTLENGLKRRYWLVHCEKCELNYPISKNKCFTEAEAIKYWNTRQPMQEVCGYRCGRAHINLEK